MRKGRTGNSPTYSDPSPSGRGHILVRDEWGAAIADGLTVAPSDLIVHKHRLSGFWDNELDSILRQRGITTLAVRGHQYRPLRVLDAAGRQFPRLRLHAGRDSCQTVSPDFVRDAVLYLVRLLHGFVATSDAILTAVGQPGPRLLPQTKNPLTGVRHDPTPSNIPLSRSRPPSASLRRLPGDAGRGADQAENGSELEISGPAGLVLPRRRQGLFQSRRPRRARWTRATARPPPCRWSRTAPTTSASATSTR